VDERGTVTPVLVILLAAGVAALGLAVDLGRFAAAAREVAYAADAGAEAGAARIDRAGAYAGEIRLDPAEARAAALRGAQRARPRAGRTVEVFADRYRVCVTARLRVEPGLLRAFGVKPWTVASTACASPAVG
jgi:hypothetical protein